MAFESVDSSVSAEQNKEGNISFQLLEALPEISKEIIKDQPENKKFKENPDSPKEHERKFHQYGIITHTKELIDFYKNESGKAFEQWNIKDKIDEKLSEKIGDRQKAELLEVGMALHDVGKFDRNIKAFNFPDYKGHEIKSEAIIRNNAQVQSILREKYNLSDEQIDYIAKIAGLHYKLGEVRNFAKTGGKKFDLDFVNSEDCEKLCRELAEEFPEFKQEIGIMFFCDNMAKTDFIVGAEDDREIENLTKEIEKDLNDYKVSSKLIKVIKQIPVNLALAEKYLKSVNR